MFGTQYSWDIASNSPTDPEYHNGIDFWVINETQLTGKFYFHSLLQSINNINLLFIALLANTFSSLGSASITGLYLIVLLTVGNYFRGFLVPVVSGIMYNILPDQQPILELISGLYITRYMNYEYVMTI